MIELEPVTMSDTLAFLRTLPRKAQPYPPYMVAEWRGIQFTGEYNLPLAMEQAKQWGERLVEDMPLETDS